MNLDLLIFHLSRPTWSEESSLCFPRGWLISTTVALLGLWPQPHETRTQVRSTAHENPLIMTHPWSLPLCYSLGGVSLCESKIVLLISELRDFNIPAFWNKPLPFCLFSWNTTLIVHEDKLSRSSKEWYHTVLTRETLYYETIFQPHAPAGLTLQRCDESVTPQTTKSIINDYVLRRQSVSLLITEKEMCCLHLLNSLCQSASFNCVNAIVSEVSWVDMCGGGHLWLRSWLK